MVVDWTGDSPSCLACARLASRTRQEPALEVAEPLRAILDAVLRAPMSRKQHAAVRALLRCRTAELGGHLDTCAAYASLALRIARVAIATVPSVMDWRRRGGSGHACARAPRFPVAFILSAELRSLALRNRRLVFALLTVRGLRASALTGSGCRRANRECGLTMVRSPKQSVGGSDELQPVSADRREGVHINEQGAGAESRRAISLAPALCAASALRRDDSLTTRIRR